MDIYNNYGGKRAFDIAAAAALIAPAAAISLVCAFARAHDDLKTHGTKLSLLERLRGKGLFFNQMRTGRHGEEFKILKVKTMRDPEYDGQSNDERIGTVGHWLRSHKCDELPQIWNVLRGQMSIVGPRPVSPGDPEAKDEFRHSVRPGLLSTAAVLGVRNTLPPDKLIALDHADIQASSLRRDLNMAVQFVKNRGAIKEAPNHRELHSLEL
ncbi:MAG: sugar transferase [Alphaproteobacteria bacterium]|nr:sugar transferase [Alphaproteobacteria bacterium]